MVEHPTTEWDDAAGFFGDGNELVWGDRPTRRMFPTDQGFETTEAQRRQVDKRLVLQQELRLQVSGDNYRRWVNFPWAVVELGGPEAAGEWTARDAARLRAVVSRAHDLGLWVRFYTLNGHTPGTGLGWTASYNFGSLDAVEPRWRAAIAAGVELIATDQYEELAKLLRLRPS